MQDTIKRNGVKLCWQKLKLDNDNNMLMILFTELLESFPKNMVEVWLLQKNTLWNMLLVKANLANIFSHIYFYFYFLVF